MFKKIIKQLKILRYQFICLKFKLSNKHLCEVCITGRDHWLVTTAH